MANNRNLINAFDDALERLTNGENLERILKDYPDSADYLRDLLMISEVVAQVHDEDSDADSAQERGREKLLQVLDKKPKRQARRRNWFMPLTAATIVLLVGVGFLMFAIGGNSGGMSMERTQLASLNTTTERLIQSTQTMSANFAQSTQIPVDVSATQGIVTMTSAATVALATDAHLTRVAQAVFDPFELTATALIQSVTQTAFANEGFPTPSSFDPFELTATALIQVATATAWDSGGMPTPSSFDPFELTATSIIQQATQNAAALVPMDSQNSGIIATSVASMGQVSATPAPFSTGDYARTQAAYMQMTATAIRNLYNVTSIVDVSSPDTGGNDLEVTVAPIETLRPSVTSSAPTATVTATGTAAPTATPSPIGTIPPSTRVADASLLFPTFTPTPAQIPVLMPLNAGEIDDNADWDTYLLYRRNFAEQGYPVYEVDVTGRQIIRVIDEQGLPILGATVTIFVDDRIVSQTLSNAEGKTQFFPNANEVTRALQVFSVTVTSMDAGQTFTIDRNLQSTRDVTLSTNVNRRDVKLDVLFLIDTTSSMGDEIAQLQNNILHISSEVDSLPGNMDVHYGLVLYRDHGNFEYVTRRYPFTANVNEFQTNLNTAEANSGDNNVDWDEALNVGFDEAVNQMEWRGNDTIKLIFLVADARPHINHPLETTRYDVTMLQALARGIKVHPIASSGLEAPGEYIFRQIAQATMGHFIFLTYDNGVVGTIGDTRPDLNVGEADTTTSTTTGDYTVERLDELVLRLIQDEITIFQGDKKP